MSYDLAVWVGPPPVEEAAVFERYRRLVRNTEQCNYPPVPALVAFVEELLDLLPDDPDQVGGSPWAGPPLEDAVGDLVILSFTGQAIALAQSVCSRLASERGLTCYNPQTGSVVEACQASRARLTWP